VERSIVRSAVWLLFTLVGVAGLFLLLRADFLGAAQILVYVGGTLVILVFGVMLTAQSPGANPAPRGLDWLAAGVAALLLAAVLVPTLWKTPTPGTGRDALPGTTPLGQALLGVEEATPEGNITNLPEGQKRPRPRTAYLLPFEAVSVHLLVVLIGAAYLARARRQQPPAEKGVQP
jgi:NADH-quinone oxidoreductase subunit J